MIFFTKTKSKQKKMYKEKEVIHAEILTYTITTSCARIQLPDSGVEAEYFVFSIRYSNCQYSIFKHQYSIFKPQYLIFKPQYSIFRLLYLSYFHYLNNYEGANGVPNS